MNDIGYLDIIFSESESRTSILTAPRWALKNRLRYAEMAVEFHKEEQNPKQEKFFTEEVALIKKLLNRRNRT